MLIGGLFTAVLSETWYSVAVRLSENGAADPPGSTATR